MSGGPCMCGACDCPSCGPAQGYTVVRVWDHKLGRYVHRNPEDDEEDDEEEDDREFEPAFEPDDIADSMKAALVASLRAQFDKEAA